MNLPWLHEAPIRYVGIDIGSVSLNVAVLDAEGEVVAGHYERTNGQPVACLLDFLEQLEPSVPQAAVVGTGSGRPLLSGLLGLPVENEIITHAWGAVHFHPDARTVIEIGGQDSKLILLEGRAPDGRPLIVDHAMNEVCAAGTGSFLDQQAARLGVAIEGEFGALALRSGHPAAVAGRCSVFAKSDMIHLQQEGYPEEDIIAGLCSALARNYLGNLGRGRKILPPVLFQGGVAANQGVVRAFEDLLELGSARLIIPERYELMGAIGAALMARAEAAQPVAVAELAARLRDHLTGERPRSSRLPPLGTRRPPRPRPATASPCDGPGPFFLGIDVGSVSTNIVLIDTGGQVCHELYLYTEGDPIRAVRTGLAGTGKALPSARSDGRPVPEIRAVGVTGSGRHLIGDFAGADLVVNEITAQARAATAIDPAADTVFEIGGQDSKFIRLRDGAVVDFEMNKVCAAGTGAFLAEQGSRLNVSIEEEFSRLALRADAPVDLGSRCTVFMESDLIHHQQQGDTQANLVAGLAYAIARNYLEKVVGHKPIGERILFQGGVASNQSVVAAFGNLLERPIRVPPHNRGTGAIGAALLAREALGDGRTSTFLGFDLSERSYQTESFKCEACPNRCDIKKVIFDGATASFYGSICGKYDVRDQPLAGPDPIAEREKLLLDEWVPEGPAPGAPAIGIPRILLFHELFPEWCAFFQSLGYRVILSDPTNRGIINQSLEHAVVETCLPIKVAYGHVLDLISKGAERVFLPAIIELSGQDSSQKNFMCPYTQNVSALIRSAFPDVDALRPVITCAGRRSNWRKAMFKLASELGHRPRAARRALAAARRAQRRFETRRSEHGREILASLAPKQTTVAVFGHPYNVYDPALSMQVARKLRQRGVLPIPIDFLPLREVELDRAWDDVVWKTGRDFLAAAEIVRKSPRLHPLHISNFGCGPDSFLLSMLEEIFGDRPFSTLELDEHFADAGIVTRLEAFIHEISARRPEVHGRPHSRPSSVRVPRRRQLEGRIVYIPSPSPHALAVQAAFRSIDIETRLLPPPDQHTEDLGRRATKSRGCIPLIFFAGDALRMTEEPDFDPARAAFFCPTCDDACKISQYPRTVRRVLDEVGARAVHLVAPRLSMESAETLHAFGQRFDRVFWRALVAVDMLLQKRYAQRPHEARHGQTDTVFDDHSVRVAEAAASRGFGAVICGALSALDSVPTCSPSSSKLRVGLIGEHYVKSNAHVNGGLIGEIERLGGEAWPAPYFTDYLRIQARAYPWLARRAGRYLRFLLGLVRWMIEERDYRWIERLFVGHLPASPEPEPVRILADAATYLNTETDGRALAAIAKGVDFIRKGVAGLVHVMPLNCMSATCVAGVLPQLRADHHQVPILTLTYDCLQTTNQRTRLQAFMHQARRHGQPEAPAISASSMTLVTAPH